MAVHTAGGCTDADVAGLLGSMDAGKTLLEQLEGGAKGERKGAFSHPFSPNWQDASTQKQCEAFDATLQEPRNLALATGSSAHHVSCQHSPSFYPC